MSTLAGNVPDHAVFSSEPLHPLTVKNYHDMIAAGILGPDDRVELLEGTLVCKMAKNPPQVYAAEQVARKLDRMLDEAFYFVKRQDPVTLADSEPEPDVMVVRGRLEDYRTRHPTPDDALLIVEVADTSLQRDRSIKQRIYARSAIAAYWIVNLQDRQIEVYESPNMAAAQPEYAPPAIYRAGQSVPVKIGGKQVGEMVVTDVLP